MSDGRFLTGSTMGHVVRMTATGAFGITFVFLVDAANLFWLSQLGKPKLVAAIGFAYAIQFFSVSSGVGLMIAATALISRRIGEDRRSEARLQAGASTVIAALIQAGVAITVIAFRHDLVALAGATGGASPRSRGAPTRWSRWRPWWSCSTAGERGPQSSSAPI